MWKPALKQKGRWVRVSKYWLLKTNLLFKIFCNSHWKVQATPCSWWTRGPWTHANCDPWSHPAWSYDARDERSLFHQGIRSSWHALIYPDHCPFSFCECGRPEADTCLCLPPKAIFHEDTSWKGPSLCSQPASPSMISVNSPRICSSRINSLRLNKSHLLQQWTSMLRSHLLLRADTR